MLNPDFGGKKKLFFKRLGLAGGFFLVLGLLLVIYFNTTNSARSEATGCQLTLEQTDNGSVQPGQNLIYHLTLTNTGTANCTATRLRFVFDPNTSYISASPAYEYKTAAYMVWLFGILAPGETKTLDLTMKVAAAVQSGTVLSNSLQSCSVETECSPFVTKHTQVVVGHCELAMAKTDNGPVQPGQNLIYHLSLTNAGTANCTESRLRDVFDQNTSYVSASTPFEEKTSTYIVWLLGTLAPGESKTVDLTMKVANSLSCPSVLSNSLQSCSVESQCSAFITKQTQVICCANDQDCSDGLSCNGQETCSGGSCRPGTPVDCSTNNLTGVTTCTNSPDDNPYTFDFRTAYVSQCDEATDACTTGDNAISHVCDVTRCQAECDAQHACADTICHTKNGCVGKDLYTYQDAANSCQGNCSCAKNSCPAPTISVNDPACTQCQKDLDCSRLDQTFCDGTVVKRTTGRCVNFSCVPNTTVIRDCNNGLFCDGAETCSQGACQPGTAVSCAGNNIYGINICTNNPDGNPYTLDFRQPFTSQCNETTDSCTAGNNTISHVCDVTRCQAECDAQHACADTICHTKNGCVGKDLYTYQDAANSCQGNCSCTKNSCPAPTITVNDPACTPCQKDADCHSLDQTFCDGTVIKRTAGRCVNFSCVANTATVKDCSDGLTCNGLETCSQATCHAGTPVNCSTNNLTGINTCTNSPDDNPYTLDRRASFTSTCQESTGTCTTGDSVINHFCSAQCGGCAVDADCNDQNPNTVDICNTGFGTGTSICQCQHTPISSGPVCGNGVKEGSEQCDTTDGVGPHQTCSSSCTLVNVQFCGDNACNNQETCSSCPQDCGGCSRGGGSRSGAVIIPGLTFNNLNATSNLCSTVLVEWSTSQFASSRVIFDTVSHSGLDNLSSPNYGYASSTVLDATPVTGHRVTITGLTPGVIYYFRPVSIAAKEKFGNEVTVKINANCASPAPVKITPPPPPPQVLGVKIKAKSTGHVLKRTGFSWPEFGLLGVAIMLLASGSSLLRKHSRA